jgi:hypothetical protein
LQNVALCFDLSRRASGSLANCWFILNANLWSTPMRLFGKASFLAMAVLSCSRVFADAPYALGPATQPPVISNNSFLGAALTVADTGFGIAGVFAGPNVHPFVISSSNGGITYLSPLTSPSTNDTFGSAVAIDSPLALGGFALVGALGDDAGNANINTNRGKVYAYRLQAGNVLVPAGEMISPNAADFANFGYSVAVQGAFAFVGEVKGKNANGDVVGSVHIFENTGGTTWTLRTSLFGTQLDGANGRRFGHSVAVAGNTLIIGAPRESDAALISNGAAYVYTGAGASWTLQQRLTTNDQASDDELGASVAVENDTAVVGALRDDKTAGADAGSAYVFTRTGSTWAQSAKLTASNAQLRNIFGQTVAISGNEIAVGGYCETNGGCPGAGSVEIYRRGPGGWISVQSIVGPAGAAFGYVAKFVPGNRTLVIGSFRAGPNGIGAVHGALGDGIFANGFE